MAYINAKNVERVYHPSQLTTLLYSMIDTLKTDIKSSFKIPGTVSTRHKYDTVLSYGKYTSSLEKVKYKVSFLPGHLNLNTSKVSFLPGHLNLNTSKAHTYALDVISKLYTDTFKLKVSDFVYQNNPDVGTLLESKGRGLQPGDILLARAYSSTNNSEYIDYLTIVIEANDGNLVTFPELYKNNADLFNIKFIRQYTITKPSKELATLAGNTGHLFYQYKNTSKLSAEIIKSTRLNVDGYLQIGDLKFLVAPQQLSFSTQNGYQYFPTIRTNGNPNIPTAQEAKQVNITLIFPNVDSINNQLLPLFAMFKRTPFVNVYNKDISMFFSELKDEEDFVSFALEDLYIQTIKGFPNTLQANITILPFQKESFGSAFKALKTFDDVKYKQVVEDFRTSRIDNIVENIQNRLNDNKEIYATNIFRKVKGPYSKYGFRLTSDFTLSEPFRAYYQGLLAYRTVVEDELGNIVKKSNREPIYIEAFRPKKAANLIHKYVAEHNQNRPIVMNYSYIDESVREFRKKMNDQQQEARRKVAKQTRSAREMFEAIGDTSFNESLNTVIHTRQDFFDSILATYQFSSFDNFFSRVLVQYGVEVHSDNDIEKISGYLDLLFKYLKFGVKVDNVSWNDLEGGFNLVFGNAFKLVKSKYSFKGEARDQIDLLTGFTLIDTKTNKEVSTKEFTNNLLTKIQKLYVNIKDEKTKSVIAAFWDSIFNTISSGGDVVDLNTFMFKNLDGILRSSITIDNVNDIIEGWSISYSNKLIPMQLLGFKYPFYQHIGSNNINVQLSITSLQNGRKVGLKDEFSILNDRLQRTAKIILMNMPELLKLYNYTVSLDTVPLGNIFSIFGLKQLVFNNSNVSNIPGKPNAWAITVNFTQDLLTIREYQSIDQVPNTFGFAPEIANKLIRSRIITEDNDPSGYAKGDVVVYDLQLKKTLKDSDIDSVDPSKFDQSILSVLMPKEDYTKSAVSAAVEAQDKIDKKRLGPIQHGDETTYISEINNLFIYYFALLKQKTLAKKNDIDLFKDDVIKVTQSDGTVVEQKFNFKSNDQILEAFELVPNKIESKKLKKVFDNSDFFRDSYKGLLVEIDTLYETSAGIMLKAYEDIEVDPHIFIAEAMMSVGFFGVVGAALLGSLAVMTGGVALLAGGMVIGMVGITLDQNKKESIKATIRKHHSLLKNILDNITSKYIRDISRIILRDPPIIKALYSEELYTDVMTIIRTAGINCYKDFDIRLDSLNVLNGETLQFSPEFYLFNKYDLNTKKDEFIKDQLKNKISAAEIQSNMILKETTEVLDMLRNINDEVFKDDATFFTQIKTDLNYIKNNSTSSDPNSYEMDYDELFKKIKNVYGKIIEEYSGVSKYKMINGKKVVTSTTNGIDIDLLKFNLLNTARMKRAIELKLIQNTINDSLNADNPDDKTTDKSNKKNTLDALTEMGIALESMDKYKNYIKKYFEQYVSTVEIQWNPDLYKGELQSESFKTAKELKKEKEKRIKEDKEKLYNPDAKHGSITNFEISIYTRLYQLYLLDSAIKDAVANEKIPSDKYDLSDIPELQLLKWYGFRSAEQSVKDIEFLEKLYHSDLSQQAKGMRKLFPTQKIYLVEEDRHTFKNLDDYYSYDAIQSIDIVSNKYSAGKTAVLRLGNIYNNITDKISLMTERLTIEERSQLNTDNVFMGTLDVKPGTKIIIKQGYDANDKFLPVVFIGKIVDMRPGPVTEIIAQSYGTQLNHYIEKLNFGFKSSANEHGDVAITLLDQMFGSDGLGKIDPMNIRRNYFTGKNLSKMRENSFSKFLISNILSRVNIGLFANDNPRDDNIFLPMRILDSIMDHVTFDWRIYQQTIWQALQELALYHKNTFPMVKLYNYDGLSNLDEIRETVIIGNKAGYYKYTDAFGLSSINYAAIKNALEEWNDIKDDVVDVLKTITNFRAVNDTLVKFYAHIAFPMTNYKGSKVKFKTLVDSNYIKTFDVPGDNKNDPQHVGIEHTTKSKKLSKILNNKYLILMLVKKYFVKSLNTSAQGSFQKLMADLFNEKTNGLIDSNILKGLKFLMQVYMIEKSYSNANIIGVYTRTIRGKYNLESYKVYDKPFLLFLHALSLLVSEGNKVQKDDPKRFEFLSEELKIEDYMDLRELILDNTDESLTTNLQYKPIQTHHFITDNNDILSNNITINQNFNNAVKLYYTREPVYSLDNISNEDDIIPMVVKAFGDTKDGDTRVLESFQKNIDPNYYEISNDLLDIFGNWNGVTKINTDDNSLTAFNTSNYDFNNPKWSKLPAFYKVAIGLLQREIEQMYRGTLQIVGYPYIEPFDIIHLEDNMNNMIGTIEVEEVIHTFNPQQGFITTITPNLITYDRDPIRMAELNMMKDVLSMGDDFRSYAQKQSVFNLVKDVVATGFFAAQTSAGIATAETGIGLAWAGTFGLLTLSSAKATFTDIKNLVVGNRNKYTSFLYDHFANLFGRDCINFTALTYHGVPFMGGFGNIDYTNINTIINHQSVEGNFTRRMANATDTQYLWMASGGDLNNISKFTAFVMGEGANGSNHWYVRGAAWWMKGVFILNDWSTDGKMKWSLGDWVEHQAK